MDIHYVALNIKFMSYFHGNRKSIPMEMVH